MQSPTEGRFVRRFFLLLAVVGATVCVSPYASEAVQSGDIVFQTSRSSQSQAIQLATHSPYSHMGLVLIRSGKPYVLEAVATVRFTPLDEWSARGEGGQYVVKRLKNTGLLAAPGNMGRLEKAALAFLGHPYDPYFEWSDDRIYCSELVWKAYDQALGLQIGELARLSTFDLSSAAVKNKLTERYGGKVPMNELVISPAAMFASSLLETVQ